MRSSRRPSGQRRTRIGRRLVEKLTPLQIAENVFEVVNQFNAGRALISDSDEAERAAELNLLAGQKAKAGTAYASAVRYLAIGMDLVGDRGWDRRYDLTFALWLEAADCEYLNGNFENTDRLAAELRSRQDPTSTRPRPTERRFSFMLRRRGIARRSRMGSNACNCSASKFRLAPPEPTFSPNTKGYGAT